LAASAFARSSLHPQVFRGLPAFALDDIEFNLRAFDEGAITGLLYFLNVDVPAAVAVLDETIALLRFKLRALGSQGEGSGAVAQDGAVSSVDEQKPFTIKRPRYRPQVGGFDRWRYVSSEFKLA
jgi:hypothetical protein